MNPLSKAWEWLLTTKKPEPQVHTCPMCQYTWTPKPSASSVSSGGSQNSSSVDLQVDPL